MVLHNPNNWHWVNRDASSWARSWLEQELVGTKASEGDVSAEITKVTSMEGDVDVSQRKGKVITLFDVELRLEYSGKAPEASDVTGNVKIPEVAHDTDEDEYVFDIDIYSESAAKEPVKDLLRKAVTPQLRQKLQRLGPALIEEHGKHIQHAPGSDPGATFSTATKYTSSSHVSTSASTSKATDETTQRDGSRSVNVTTLTDETEFRTTAEELYATFTDAQRVAAFTRDRPKVFEAKEGGSFELFGGNVSGQFSKLKKPTEIVQKWRLAQWPKEHYSTLNIKFDQNDVDAVTVMRVSWAGVPIGQEEVTKRNWGEYYVRSIKTTFGFGTIL